MDVLTGPQITKEVCISISYERNFSFLLSLWGYKFVKFNKTAIMGSTVSFVFYANHITSHHFNYHLYLSNSPVESRSWPLSWTPLSHFWLPTGRFHVGASASPWTHQKLSVSRHWLLLLSSSKWEGVCLDFHAVHFKVREMCSSFQACLHFREIFCQTLSLYTLIPNFCLPCLCYFVTMILTMLFSLPLFQIPSNL